MSNRLDPAQARGFFTPNLGPIHLQRVSADGTKRQSVKVGEKIQSLLDRSVKNNKINVRICLLILIVCQIQDLFQVYLSRCEFHFLLLHINKTNTFSFLTSNVGVPGVAK